MPGSTRFTHLVEPVSLGLVRFVISTFCSRIRGHCLLLRRVISPWKDIFAPILSAPESSHPRMPDSLAFSLPDFSLEDQVTLPVLVSAYEKENWTSHLPSSLSLPRWEENLKDLALPKNFCLP